MSRPSNLTVPDSLLSVPHRQLTNVLLPDPLGPIKPTRSPAVTVSSIFSSATNPPKRFPKSKTSRRFWAMCLRLLAPVIVDQSDNSFRRDDDEEDEQDADN